MRHIKITMSDEEYLAVKKAAGYEAMAAFVRRQVVVAAGLENENRKNGAEKAEGYQYHPSIVNVTEVGVVDGLTGKPINPRARKTKPIKDDDAKCRHGYQVGKICFDCGGHAHA